MKTHDKQVIDYGERKDYLNLFLINDMQDMCHIKRVENRTEKDPVYFLWKMVHEQVITDRLRESRIMLNLLSDIAKFKEQGRRTPTDTL